MAHIPMDFSALELQVINQIVQADANFSRLPQGATTGRTAKSDPELQDFKFPDSKGKVLRIRNISFGTRILRRAPPQPTALVSGADGVMEPFDAHKEAAAKIFGVPYEDVTPDQRKVGKSANFTKDYF